LHFKLTTDQLDIRKAVREFAVEVTDEAIQVLGGAGYLAENEVERFYRDAKIIEIYEGTREIQKNTIVRFMLKKGIKN
jgi:alkylation response protein AidB-like acyl-CoA dehydrogenase